MMEMAKGYISIQSAFHIKILQTKKKSVVLEITCYGQEPVVREYEKNDTSNWHLHVNLEGGE